MKTKTKLIKQPAFTHICGQCCVAMALGHSDARIMISLLGRGRTRYSQLRRAIEQITLHHVTLGRVVIYNHTYLDNPGPVGTFILKVGSRKPWKGHYVLMVDGRIYDSCLDRSLLFRNWVKFRNRVYPHTRIMSWAEVREVPPTIGLHLEKLRKELPALFEMEGSLSEVVGTERVLVSSRGFKVPVKPC